MQQHHPIDEFPPPRSSGQMAGRPKLSIVALFVSLVVAAAAGYVTGLRLWTLPTAVMDYMPASLAKLLAGPTPSAQGEKIKVLTNYVFELVETELKQGEVVVSVRLINKKDGSAIPGAVIYGHRLDMAPEGMPTMTTPLEILPEETPGIYRFKTDLTMEGKWRLSLAAKIQDEVGTVRDRIEFTAGS